MADLFRSEHHPKVRDDILALPTLELRKIALIRITQLVRGDIIGRPLDREPLVGAYKLYFPEHHLLARTEQERRAVDQTTNGGWRIVYRLLDPLPGADRRQRLQVLAVGPRADNRVYNAANERLLPSRPAAPAAVPAPRTPMALPPPRSLREAQQAALQRQTRYLRPLWR